MSARTKRHHRASVNECRKCWSVSCTCKEDRKKSDKRQAKEEIEDALECYDKTTDDQRDHNMLMYELYG